MEKNVKENNVKGIEKEKVGKEVIKMEMVKFSGVGFDEKEKTVSIPKDNILLGKVLNGNCLTFTFEFEGNPNNVNRIPKTRDIDFKVILSKEVAIINEMAINDKWKAIALIRKTVKKGVEKRECLSVSIVSNDYKTWLLTNGSVASAIDIITLALKVNDWNEGHAVYKKLTHRNGKNSNSNKVHATVSTNEFDMNIL